MTRAKKAQLIVRDVDRHLVVLLKVRAARNARSAEAEHRAILRQALEGGGDAVDFDRFLRELPNVGEDGDFERPRDLRRRVKL